MPIKKSELYSSLWASCDELRGGMDASQYKDYVLVMLFIKYISDKYAGIPFAPITVPKGSSFKDMVQLKGKPTIGDDINKKILGPIGEANRIADFPDFNDVNKLGSGQEMVKRLTNLIAIFESKDLDFSKNRAEGDDILGDAYEYLMRHFATESGKSKGQFYTPAEVSRVMAKIIGIKNAKTTASTTVYDPTCGSGSLLLKVADEADTPVSLFGQEMDVATASLARMNMILHNNPSADIKQGNTLANPLFKDDSGNLKTWDYVVANPPFSFKSWSNGVDAVNDPFGRFQHFGTPPSKNGDYAFLLHIVRSLKSTGKGAVILPHGVLFRGNAEAEIRRNLIQRGYIKGIIGLPANLFYGTGIPACIIVIDKAGAEKRNGIFMIDAGKGFMKDGNKNRLREQDIHKIVDVFNNQIEVPKFSRFISNEEIADPKNDYNLNIPRYIDSQEPEDIQDIEAHLLGGIPNADIDALADYWEVYPGLRKALFGKTDRPKYSRLKIEKDQIKHTIFHHPDFIQFSEKMDAVFNGWKKRTAKKLKDLAPGFKPKELIYEISESLLAAYSDIHLIDKYDAYQHLLNYWVDVMQDDCYLLTTDGWKAEVTRIIVQNKKGGQVDKGWTCELIPPAIVIDRYFAKEKSMITQLEAERDALVARQEELEEENSGEDGYFAEMEKVNKASAQKRLKEIKSDKEAKDEAKILHAYVKLCDDQSDLNAKIKTAAEDLDKITLKRYSELNDAEIKKLVVDDKWMTSIDKLIKGEMDRMSQRLAQRIKELAERYETPLPVQTKEVADLEKKVSVHLEKMGFIWS